MAMPMPISGNSKVYSSSSNFTPLLQTPSHLLDSLWLHPSNNPTFQVSGSKPLVDFSTPAPPEKDDTAGAGAGELDEYDGCFPYQQGKKRRLTSEQVQFLEKSFEVENKLEPERKIELAKELGLQPRQVAIWFQNRRARFKTKQLERDYGTLKANYDKLKAEYDSLLHHNDNLKQEVNSLKEKLKEEKSQEVVISSENEDDGSKAVNSAKSDVFDSDSPHNHTADSSNHHNHNQALIMEAEQYSHFSQDNEEVDKMNDSLMMPPPPCLPKLEEEEDHTDHGDVTTTTPCSFGFPDEEDQAFCFWPY